VEHRVLSILWPSSRSIASGTKADLSKPQVRVGLWKTLKDDRSRD